MDSEVSQAQVGLELQIRAARSCLVSCCRNLEIQRLVFLSKSIEASISSLTEASSSRQGEEFESRTCV